MFKGLSVFFETYSITAEDNKNAALHPIDVSCGMETCMRKFADYFAQKGYFSITEDHAFYEIFAKDANYEYTVSFINLPNSGTRIGAAVFSPNKRTKKVLIKFMDEVRTLFANNIL